MTNLPAPARFHAGQAPIGRFDARLRHLRHVDATRSQHAASLRLDQEMRDGLARGEFRVHYQPIVTLPDGEIVAVEALVRWQHPERGLVPPFEFIPFAEESGLIGDLGTFVLFEACRQVRRWQLSVPDLAFLRVAVNLSAHQLTADLVELVRRALTSSGLPAESLELEVTESVAMADIDGALEVLDAVAALGVGLSIDDFGTGYSSLAYLKRLPVTGLKIDKAFVDDLADHRDVSIVGAVIAVAAALGLSQIAEGVETQEQRDQLEALGCAHAQGYLFSRPCPAETFVDDVRHLIGGNRSSIPGEDLHDPVRVVVCDDEVSIRRLYRRALRSGNVEVFDAETAEECLERVRHTKPDLVILDAKLEGRGGIEIIEEIRGLHPDAHVVIVSGTVTRDMVTASHAAGANACVQKMQFLPQLVSLVESCRP